MKHSMKISLLAIAATTVLLSACAGNQVCKDDADYRKAGAITPIQAAEGLSLPQSASALKVPDITPAAHVAAQQPLPKKGKGTACLDYPPEITPSEAAPVPAKS